MVDVVGQTCHHNIEVFLLCKEIFKFERLLKTLKIKLNYERNTSSTEKACE